MRAQLTLIHAYSDEVEIKTVPDRNAANGYIYLMPERDSIIQWARTVYQADKDRNEWIRRYDNLLKGLNYWKDRALMTPKPEEG